MTLLIVDLTKDFSIGFTVAGVNWASTNPPYTVTLTDETPSTGQSQPNGVVDATGVHGHRIEKTIRMKIDINDASGATPPYAVLVNLSLGGLHTAPRRQAAEQRREVGAPLRVGALEALEALVRGARIWSSPSRSRPRAATGRGRRVSEVMSRAATKKTAKGLGSTLERVRQGERVVLRHGRKVVGAVVPIEDLKRLQQLEDEEDLRDVRAALKEARRKGTIPWERVKAELGLR